MIGMKGSEALNLFYTGVTLLFIYESIDKVNEGLKWPFEEWQVTCG